MKKVSIIIPIYNAEAYLRRCLESILRQTYKNYELILINDGSLDSSRAICEEYASKDNRITLINQPNSGVSKARNAGIDLATGDYTTFIDADDWVEADAIETMVDLAENANVQCVRTMYYENYIDGKQKKRSMTALREGIYSGEEVKRELLSFLGGKEFCYTVLLLIRDDLLKKVGHFDEDIKLMEDTLFYARILSLADKVLFSDKATYHYFQNGESASKSPAKFRENISSILKVNSRIIRWLRDKKLLNKPLLTTINTTHALLITNYLFRMYASGSSKESVRTLYNGLRSNRDYMNLVQKANKNSLPLHLMYTIHCVVKDKPETLLRFFRLRLIMMKLKKAVKQ